VNRIVEFLSVVEDDSCNVSQLSFALQCFSWIGLIVRRLGRAWSVRREGDLGGASRRCAAWRAQLDVYQR
jgi:hypothetical protein